MSTVSQLSSLTFIDEETVKTQLIPYLESFKSKADLQDHLENLLGKSTPESQAFISSYLFLRFPPSLPTPAPISAPAPVVASKPKPSTKPKKLNPNGPKPGRDWTNDFGATGTVYIKQAEESWSTSNRSGSSDAGDVGSRGSSGRSTPVPLGGTPSIKIVPSKKSSAAKTGSMVSDMLKGTGLKVVETSNQSKKPVEKKSAEVERMENLIRDVENYGVGGDGLGKRALKKGRAGGCFCRARVHPLSSHCPMCPSCSLPLCKLQPPFLPCPSCVSPLLTSSSQLRLLAQLQSELAAQLASEQAERDRVIREAREQAWRESSGGAFPTLTPSTAADKLKEDSDGRRVMSLNAKTGKVQMTSYSKKISPVPSSSIDETGSQPKGEPDEEEEIKRTEGRVRKPRTEPLSLEERKEGWEAVSRERDQLARFFLNVSEGSIQAIYKEMTCEANAEDNLGEVEDKKSKRRRGRGKGKDHKEESGKPDSISTVSDLETTTGLTRKERGKQIEAHQTNNQPRHISSDTAAPPTTASAPIASTTSTTSRYSPSHPPPVRLLLPGTKVLLIKKEDQPTGKTTAGEVGEVLTRGDHPRGVKVRSKNGIVGRVVGLI
ncbi:Zinc finger, C2HC5-type [Phaffia rhodozyma]|uniref:Zinc finger, C2HC5-type n=1 Tax=Phaffia rhodozyma TaxID=264483 RepID=A0A0F7SH69_PHARH|nr:Zinc finger, C2HC5-type [Phaffia rhodozyma]